MGVRTRTTKRRAVRLPGRPSFRARLFPAVVVLLSLASIGMSVSGVAAASGHGDDREDGGLVLLGYIPSPSTSSMDVAFVNSLTRRFYGEVNNIPNILTEYDLSQPGVPPLTRKISFPGPDEPLLGYSGLGQPNLLSVDEAGKRVFALTPQSQLGNSDAGPEQFLLFGQFIRVFDTDPTHPLRFVRLPTGAPFEWSIHRKLPGVAWQGMTYSPSDGRAYLLGHANVFETSPFRGATAFKPATAVVVAALDLWDPATNQYRPDLPSFAWVKWVPQCGHLLDQDFVGSASNLSSGGEKLYFPCIRKTGMPGHSGLARLWVKKPDGTLPGHADAPTMKTDFFPISGVYTDGVPSFEPSGKSGFDPVTERFFIQSQSTQTPGVWVFDGKFGAWVGFIQATCRGDGLGFDPSSGHIFMHDGTYNPDAPPDQRCSSAQSKKPYMRVADIRTTPVSQGKAYPVAAVYPKQLGVYLTDPQTHRLFIFNPDFRGVAVYRDDTQVTDPPIKQADHDSETQAISENPHTNSRFEAKAAGYGTRAFLLNGYGGVLGSTGVFTLTNQPQPNLCPHEDLCFLPVDRDLHGAAIGSLDISASVFGDNPPSIGKILAFAQALAPSDQKTEAEWGASSGKPWPWRQVSCADQASPDPGPGGAAVAICDEEVPGAQATSSFGKISFPQVSVGSSSFAAWASRDLAKGIVTHVESVARGITISHPEHGSATIPQLKVVAEVSAKGRPQASSTWTRTVSGVEITSAQGNQSLPSCTTTVTGGATVQETGNCKQITDALNQLLTKGQVRLPYPEVTATPKGAFAQVRKPLADHLQGRVINNELDGGDNTTWASPGMEIEVINDAEEKARLLVQIAGVEASSIYKVNCPPIQLSAGACNPLPEDTEEPSSPTEDDQDGATSVTTYLEDDEVLTRASSSHTPTLVERIKRILRAIAALPGAALAFLIRNPKEALLFAGMWILLASAPGSVWRRRQLVRELV